MKSFIIRGTIQNGNVVFNVKALNFKQRQFVQACAVEMNRDARLKTATQADSLAVVMYKDKNDFGGMLMVGLNTTPDQAWQKFESDFRKATSKYPQIGMRYTRDEIVELGTEYAGRMMDMLADGAQWPWANAHAVFERDGDELVVVATT